MAIYLNTKGCFKNYKELCRDEFFVDKTKIISMINKKISTKNKYICITRPRRFGKTSVADMLASYYTKSDEALKQIKEKEYFQKFIKEYENILAAAICYDSKNKDHTCKIEKISLTK